MTTKASRKTGPKQATTTATVAVLAGGVSAEREISLQTGQAVHKALQKNGHKVRQIDLTHSNLRQLNGTSCDAVFLALHGTFGEDGQIQRMLDERGIRYTGSSAEASANAMDKLRSKILFLKNGIPTAPYHEVTAEATANDISRIQRRLGLPLVVKPAAEGSSVGVSKVSMPGELTPAINKALKFGERAMIERFLTGREVVVGILNDQPLPVIEIRSPDALFTYEAKYRDSTTEYDMEPDIDPERLDEIRYTALAAHKALGCRHYSRVDLIYGPNDKINVLEVNSLPGLTERSLLPKAAQAAGISFPKVCDKILQLALHLELRG